jgi:hypothetical protein
MPMAEEKRKPNWMVLTPVMSDPQYSYNVTIRILKSLLQLDVQAETRD